MYTRVCQALSATAENIHVLTAQLLCNTTKSRGCRKHSLTQWHSSLHYSDQIDREYLVQVAPH
jgi:hypothetical protein